jgi:hypothetical protein
VNRASDFAIGLGVVISTCSAEDLIVFKAFGSREKDWLDIEGIATRQACRLDDGLIWSELVPLLDLKGTPEDAERLRAILGRARA